MAVKSVITVFAGAEQKLAQQAPVQFAAIGKWLKARGHEHMLALQDRFGGRGSHPGYVAGAVVTDLNEDMLADFFMALAWDQPGRAMLVIWSGADRHDKLYRPRGWRHDAVDLESSLQDSAFVLSNLGVNIALPSLDSILRHYTRHDLMQAREALELHGFRLVDRAGQIFSQGEME